MFFINTYAKIRIPTNNGEIRIFLYIYYFKMTIYAVLNHIGFNSPHLRVTVIIRTTVSRGGFALTLC